MTAELIARLDAATGPDRELDAAIDAETFDGPIIERTCCCTGACIKGHPRYQGACVCVPRYTASIDAALTLVPEGYSVELGIYVEDDLYKGPTPGCCARVSKYCMGDGPGWERDVEAATPALAIVIAALRTIEARQQ